ncbi:glycoside hydrolase family 43 protein [Pedobacter duraquae]|uniref:Glycosyl hydrolase family 43 n=1 Tax=Pedobacter duraquae TaxID=425511 RepID=A0A4R6IEP6_9SPHI|nr:glycoside hydrolase family 43 protein [Pedobacter duraquae]TDO20226.1 glycosyl hydrolase family 43 [Pedobacter duraquae]
MRTSNLLLCLVFFTSAIFAQQKAAQKTSGNPIFPGWYADPEGAIFGREYWVYPTYSAKYKEQVFMDAFSSKDLINWTKHPNILQNKDVKWADKAMWAPSITKKDNKYYLFFGANDIQNNDELGGIGVAVSNKPEGPFIDHIGKPLIDKFHNGAQPIDQYIFNDKDGQYYLYYGGWKHCNVVKLSDDFKSVVPFPDGSTYKEITPENYVEGPFMFMRNGKYYFMWSEGGWTGPNYFVAYAIADSPIGPFKRIDRILKQDTAIATGAGHNSVIQNPKTKEYYILYHRRPLGETNGNHRVTCIEKMEFDENGYIKPVQITFEGVGASKL